MFLFLGVNSLSYWLPYALSRSLVLIVPVIKVGRRMAPSEVIARSLAGIGKDLMSLVDFLEHDVRAMAPFLAAALVLVRVPIEALLAVRLLEVRTRGFRVDSQNIIVRLLRLRSGFCTARNPIASAGSVARGHEKQLFVILGRLFEVIERKVALHLEPRV